MTRAILWLRRLIHAHQWQPATTRRGGCFERCCVCEAERIGGLVVELERRRRR